MLDFRVYFNVLNCELIFPEGFFCGGSVCSVDCGRIHKRWFPSCPCQIVTNSACFRPILLNRKIWVLHLDAAEMRASDFFQLNHVAPVV